MSRDDYLPAMEQDLFIYNSLYAHRKLRIVISNMDINIDTIDDSFAVMISVSAILSCRGIGSSIDDTSILLWPFFPRYFDIDTFELIHFKMFTFHVSHLVYSSRITPGLSDVQDTFKKYLEDKR